MNIFWIVLISAPELPRSNTNGFGISLAATLKMKLLESTAQAGVVIDEPTGFREMSKIMLVCSKPSEEVEKCLRTAGGEIVTVNDGEAAIIQAQHATFSMAVVVSTGNTMDLAETVFNLRDINSSMPILIIDERHGPRESQAEMIAHASPNTRALTVHDLAAHLGITGSSARRSIGKRH